MNAQIIDGPVDGTHPDPDLAKGSGVGVLNCLKWVSSSSTIYLQTYSLRRRL